VAVATQDGQKEGVYISSCFVLFNPFLHTEKRYTSETRKCVTNQGHSASGRDGGITFFGMGQPDRLCSFYICYYIGFNLMCCLSFAEFSVAFMKVGGASEWRGSIRFRLCFKWIPKSGMQLTCVEIHFKLI